jgi:hypothetical protein
MAQRAFLCYLGRQESSQNEFGQWFFSTSPIITKIPEIDNKSGTLFWAAQRPFLAESQF